MNTRFKGQKQVATGSTSNLPTVKKPRGRPRKNPPSLDPIVPPAFHGPRPRPLPLLNPLPYLPPGFGMEDEIDNPPALQRNNRNFRMEEDREEGDPPARRNNVDDQNPIRNPPFP
ncbi:unnamed protein product [Rhodiola kirilowii]